MKRLCMKCLVMSLTLGCVNSEAAERQAKVNSLPARVVEKTRKQLQDYMGQADFKGVPLLDPTIDWDAQSNWPNRFNYQGRLYQLEITDLSGDEIRTLKSKAEVRPGMTVLFGYNTVTRGANPGTKAVFPRASWSKDRNRATGKLLIWGDRELFGVRKEVFSYRFYPEGGLHEFYWQPRDSDGGQWEVYDRTAKLMGVMNSKTCLWNGAEVGKEKFLSLTRALYESGGAPATSASPAHARPNVVPPRR